jgi:hypothetical protein
MKIEHVEHVHAAICFRAHGRASAVNMVRTGSWCGWRGSRACERAWWHRRVARGGRTAQVHNELGAGGQHVQVKKLHVSSQHKNCHFLLTWMA